MPYAFNNNKSRYNLEELTKNLNASQITTGTLNSSHLPVVPLAKGGTGVNNQTITKNYIFGAPTNGNGAPLWRKLVVSDIPNLDASKITTGTLDITHLPSGTASIPDVLYSGTPSKAPITLTTPADYYNHMRIYYTVRQATNTATSPMLSLDVYDPDGKYVNLESLTYVNATTIQSRFTTIYINDTKITVARSGYANIINTSNTGVSSSTDGTQDATYIHRVEAWN